MRKFDTKVQYLNYKVIRSVARHAWNDDLLENVNKIPKEIIPGSTPTMRCCVYKERAILSERVNIAMGGDKENPNVIEVISIACDECPEGGYSVTDGCRGCLAHRCEDVCPRNALSFDEHQKAHIDKSRCVNCGRCAQVCPYSAIINRKRPCENACKIKAISMADDGSAHIDNNKCISCGACVYQCPFGAISDKSFVLNVIDMIRKRKQSKIQSICRSCTEYIKPVQICKARSGYKRNRRTRILSCYRGRTRRRYGCGFRSRRTCGKRLPHKLLLPRICRLH